MTFWILVAVFAACQVADLWLTAKALSLGAREANPVSAWLIEKSGSVWAGGLPVKVAVTALIAWSGSSVIAVFAIGLYAAWVLPNNWGVVKRLGG